MPAGLVGPVTPSIGKRLLAAVLAPPRAQLVQPLRAAFAAALTAAGARATASGPAPGALRRRRQLHGPTRTAGRTAATALLLIPQRKVRHEALILALDPHRDIRPVILGDFELRQLDRDVHLSGRGDSRNHAQAKGRPARERWERSRRISAANA